MTEHKRNKKVNRRKDYEEKKKFSERTGKFGKFHRLEAGDGLLPKSRKYRVEEE